MALPVAFGALRGLLKELQASARDRRPLVVGGAHEISRALVRELLANGGDPAAVRTGDPEGAVIYVHVGAPDEEAFKRARRVRVPIVAVVDAGEGDVPFVLTTDVVRLGAGEGFPTEAIARVIASRLGETAAPLAGRVPVLRGAVRDWLVASFARKNGVIAAAVFVPGVDLPVLTLNQVRLVLRLEQAYGLDPDLRQRAPEILASIGAGLGFRAIARELLDAVPVAGWAIKGAVAYAGTRALGEATVRRIEAAPAMQQRA
jgi:uncharacterized protein (DUF697 family)